MFELTKERKKKEMSMTDDIYKKLSFGVKISRKTSTIDEKRMSLIRN